MRSSSPSLPLGMGSPPSLSPWHGVTPFIATMAWGHPLHCHHALPQVCCARSLSPDSPSPISESRSKCLCPSGIGPFDQLNLLTLIYPISPAHTHTHTHIHTHTHTHTTHTHTHEHVYSWFIYRHAKPLPQDIVKLPPYPESKDPSRGTTVLPYLEAFFQYNVPQMDDAEGGGGARGDCDGLFVDDVESRDMFDVEGNSLLSAPSERSLDTMIQTKSRVSSQENGKCA